MKKTVIFIITHLKKIDLPNFTIDEFRKHPAHHEEMFLAEKTTLIHHYKLPKKTNEQNYLEHYKNKIKTQYNAYSVEIGVLEKQITI